MSVKICGIQSSSDAQGAIEAGADKIGVVFDPKSPRFVEGFQAVEISKIVSDSVQKVALTVDATLQVLQDIQLYFKPDILQFHGTETPDRCSALSNTLGLPWYKAIRVQAGMDIDKVITKYLDAGSQIVLLDAYHPQMHGGTGEAIDVDLLKGLKNKFILAGGLKPENVGKIIKEINPAGVDVSSGVEGMLYMKNLDKMREFVAVAKKELSR